MSILDNSSVGRLWVEFWEILGLLARRGRGQILGRFFVRWLAGLSRWLAGSFWTVVWCWKLKNPKQVLLAMFRYILSAGSLGWLAGSRARGQIVGVAN